MKIETRERFSESSEGDSLTWESIFETSVLKSETRELKSEVREREIEVRGEGAEGRCWMGGDGGKKEVGCRRQASRAQSGDESPAFQRAAPVAWMLWVGLIRGALSIVFVSKTTLLAKLWSAETCLRFRLGRLADGMGHPIAGRGMV